MHEMEDGRWKMEDGSLNKKLQIPTKIIEIWNF